MGPAAEAGVRAAGAAHDLLPAGRRVLPIQAVRRLAVRRSQPRRRHGHGVAVPAATMGTRRPRLTRAARACRRWSGRAQHAYRMLVVGCCVAVAVAVALQWVVGRSGRSQ